MAKLSLIASLAAVSMSLAACANEGRTHNHHSGGIQAPGNKAILAPFDIVHTKITTRGNVATFHMAVSWRWR